MGCHERKSAVFTVITFPGAQSRLCGRVAAIMSPVRLFTSSQSRQDPHIQEALWNHFCGCPVSCGTDEGHCHEISDCDCDSCLCRLCWAGGLFRRLAAPRKAVHADDHPIGGPISSVRGSVFASVRWLTAGATQNALAALLGSGASGALSIGSNASRFVFGTTSCLALSGDLLFRAKPEKRSSKMPRSLQSPAVCRVHSDFYALSSSSSALASCRSGVSKPSVNQP
jgi:hypothetical protein